MAYKDIDRYGIEGEEAALVAGDRDRRQGMPALQVACARRVLPADQD